ncbi:uncharacterized protein SPAPADRAFT_72715 [Spathaspora passalidarum NRRL Y-27907]|uniref:Zn(2)-C6 fungal-type domain-containing protein n=1 Tax=Spathaspora passalidarum (strain NRRL Y-27907 / 11-Y1) TaxID=619300 RepID=G3AT29_SPAPN|nr:uncharacterized protein SPAPADRAFT_72715 [Spathaspora passalidarum NRRL Y-27907]EGW30792.1 hypothetical protein SPAPADRAFT_72715 [Spathaspora passalidarum NRRL Y-27907]
MNNREGKPESGVSSLNSGTPSAIPTPQPISPQHGIGPQQQQQQYVKNQYYQANPNYYQQLPPPGMQPQVFPQGNPGPGPGPGPNQGIFQNQGPETTRATATYPRKRALTACDTCRLKKIKCDNVRPRCGSCTKNGNMNCHYRTDDQQKDYSSYDPASLNILSKLDVMLKDIKDIKSNMGIEKSDHEKRFQFDKCIWDMSLTSIFKWSSFMKTLKNTPSEAEHIQKTLINHYDDNSFTSLGRTDSLIERVQNTRLLDKFLYNNFSTIINSFFVNCYSKIPVLDTFEFFDTLEKYQLISAEMPEFSFVTLIELCDITDETVLPAKVEEIYKKQNIEINDDSIESFYKLIHSIPLIILICAIGVISTPIQLENLSSFSDSLEEARSIDLGCLGGPDVFKDLPESFPRDRVRIAVKLLNYSQLLIIGFPFLLESNTLTSVEFYLLLNQFYLYGMSPLLAHRTINTANQHMMYLLRKTNLNEVSARQRETIGRLFWSGLKLECELNVELSPFVPLSGITQMEPPISFPRIPDQASIISKSKYSDSVIKLAQKYDDEYTWYYFLTEVAVRKVDNKMCDEIYSFENSLKHSWDSEDFSENSVWHLFIKYLNQYNGIINSLSPEIRSLVLQESNVDQIYRRIKKKYDKKNDIKMEPFASVAGDIFDNLDDFLIDDDLLYRVQSESIMYIKTRVITSKLLLFRPLIYLLLEGKIPFVDLLEATMAVAEANMREASVLSNFTSTESPDSTISSQDMRAEYDIGIDYLNIIKAPQFYQKQFPEEDFSNLIEYSPKNDEDDDAVFTIKDMHQAKAKILRIFIQNLISLPKLSIPKLGAHRHPGSWYYLRNSFIGNVFQFLMYKKIHGMIETAAGDDQFKAYLAQKQQNSKDSPGGSEVKSLEEINALVNIVLSKQGILAAFEHSNILFEYWKDEVKDCEIYQAYIRRILELM